jgi:hypothetical protein
LHHLTNFRDIKFSRISSASGWVKPLDMQASAFSRTLEAKENTPDSLSFGPGNVLAEKATEIYV